MSSSLKKIHLLVAVLLLGGIFGCTLEGSPALNVTDIKSVDFSKPMKNGEACATYILGIFGPFGDPSLMNAVKNGDISKVQVIDYKNKGYVLFSQRCLEVYGK